MKGLGPYDVSRQELHKTHPVDGMRTTGPGPAQRWHKSMLLPLSKNGYAIKKRFLTCKVP
eukprot:6201253-Karenia_brevis.AAC.1